jgi:chromosome segregation ATPase
VKSLEDQRNSLAGDCEAKDSDMANLNQHLLSLQAQLEDTQEHLHLLQLKSGGHDLSSLRGKNLDLARRQIHQLNSELLLIQQRVSDLEQEKEQRER